MPMNVHVYNLWAICDNTQKMQIIISSKLDDLNIYTTAVVI